MVATQFLPSSGSLLCQASVESLVGDARRRPDRPPAVPGGPGGLGRFVEALACLACEFGSFGGGAKHLIIVVSSGDSLGS
jgi:hypothetical protein